MRSKLLSMLGISSAMWGINAPNATQHKSYLPRGTYMPTTYRSRASGVAAVKGKRHQSLKSRSNRRKAG